MESAELGAEYLIRVRVVEVSEETLTVTSVEHPPKVIAGRRRAKLLPLAVQPYMGESTQRGSRD